MRKILLYGYGGYAKVLAELLLNSGYSWIGVFDDNNLESPNPQIKYLGKYSEDIYPDLRIILAIGSSPIRQKLSGLIKHSFETFIHSSAFVSNSAQIGEGTVILQNVVIQHNVSIGKHCILNIQTSIDHDTLINDFVHIAPHAYLGSNCTVSALSDLLPGQIIPRFSNI